MRTTRKPLSETPPTPRRITAAGSPMLRKGGLRRPWRISPKPLSYSRTVPRRIKTAAWCICNRERSMRRSQISPPPSSCSRREPSPIALEATPCGAQGTWLPRLRTTPRHSTSIPTSIWPTATGPRCGWSRGISRPRLRIIRHSLSCGRMRRPIAAARLPMNRPINQMRRWRTTNGPSRWSRTPFAPISSGAIYDSNAVTGTGPCRITPRHWRWTQKPWRCICNELTCCTREARWTRRLPITRR